MEQTHTTALVIRPHQLDWYQRLRSRIDRWVRRGGRAYPWADLLLLLPDFIHLTIHLLHDTRVRVTDRALLAAVLAYVIAPIDLIPEAFVGVPGLLDDLALLAAAYHTVLVRVPASVLHDYWAGPASVLEVVAAIIRDADSWLGPRRWRWLQRLLRTETGRAESPA